MSFSYAKIPFSGETRLTISVFVLCYLVFTTPEHNLSLFFFLLVQQSICIVPISVNSCNSLKILRV